MKVAAIHLAPGRRLPMRPVTDVLAEAGKRLVTFAVGDPVELPEQ
jgi:hypothetical protein